MSINDYASGPTTLKQKIIIWAVIILLMLMSFGLGYLLRGESSQAPIIIETSGT